jgi:hypothetical protein
MPRPNFGPEYPHAVTKPDGERLPLLREKRWSREFGTEQSTLIISRFVDGSATISLAELRGEWSQWTRAERLDYAVNSSPLEGMADFPDQLRFVVSNGGPEEWSAVASSIARCLPTDEAFGILTSFLDETPQGSRSNLYQAIERVGHPGSLDVLLEELELLGAHPAIGDDDSFLNWLAYDLTCGIQHALRLGAPPAQFEDAVRRLAIHPCVGNVDAARWRLATTYDGVFGGGAA